MPIRAASFACHSVRRLVIRQRAPSDNWQRLRLEGGPAAHKSTVPSYDIVLFDEWNAEHPVEIVDERLLMPDISA